MSRFASVLVSAAMSACTGGVQAVDIDTVPVGYPGNPNDTPGHSYGAVDYLYNIGKFEVTAGQYTEFLNAVAATDTYGLYSEYMAQLNLTRGCNIQRTGSSGSYSYSVVGDWAEHPVNHVSWGDAARFANWLHNGQPTGAQDLSTTEDGSYYLNGATTDGELMAVAREEDATWVIPSEDEWYKAAYYDGAAALYFDYPTRTDTVPSNLLEDPDPGNNVTFYDGGYTIGDPYYRTEVGAHENSESPYGTFDQGGNVWEWTEAVLNGSHRFLRGGAFTSSDDSLHAAYRNYYYLPMLEGSGFGFRVAKVPVLDFTGDGNVDLHDFAFLQVRFGGDVDLHYFAWFLAAFTGPR